MKHLQCLSLQCLSLVSQAIWNHFSNTSPGPMSCIEANPHHIFSSCLIDSELIPLNIYSLSSCLFLLLLVSLYSPTPVSSLFLSSWLLLYPPSHPLSPYLFLEPMVILFQQGLYKLLQLTVFSIFCVCHRGNCCFLYFSTNRVCSNIANTFHIEVGGKQ